MHRKNLIIILGVLALISLVTTVAFARNSRFLEPPDLSGGNTSGSLSDIPVIEAKGNSNNITIEYTPLNGTGAMVGLGKNDDLVLTQTATFKLINGICTNPGGQKVDVQPVHGTAVAEEKIRKTSVENGRVNVFLSNFPENVVNPCPNSGWHYTAVLVWRGEASIAGTQDGETNVATYTCNQPDNINTPFSCDFEELISY